jgi:hypothetical protein
MLLANTEIVLLSGKARWAHLAMLEASQSGLEWNITLYPDKESLLKIEEMKTKGLMNTLKKDDDGYYIRFRRPSEKKYKGVLKALRPPEVLDKDGKTPYTGPVGNGSDVMVKLECYSFKTPYQKQSYAARLCAVRVDNLVPFEANRDMTKEQKEQVQGLTEAKGPTPVEPKRPIF